MKLGIYAIRDIKTSSYGNPMFQPTDGSMIRDFSDAVNSKQEKNHLNDHSDDFELFKLGEYETDTGEITTHAPKSLITATQLKK